MKHEQIAFDAQFWSWSTEEAFAVLSSCKDGLASGEALSRLAIAPKSIGDRRVRWWHLLLRQFRSPIILLLVASGALSLVLGEVVDSLIIIGIIGLSGVLGFVQERGAVRAVESLLSSVRVHADVLRDGSESEITVAEVVYGDVVVLRAGDVVPGDALVLESSQMLVDESSLTGESYPVSKEPGVVDPATELGLRSNCVHLGTHVVSGSGRVLVARTGTDTEFGRVAEHVARAHVPTAFERGATQFGLLLMKATAVLVAAVFAINLALNRPFVDSLLFSLALAVGLTPQMLPAIVTLSLSKGASVMARQRVIVKRLDAIEDVGSLNLLCTDKTGTLTEGSVRLDSAVGVDGRPSDRVARLARWNSAMQTGFANPIDAAILQAVSPSGDSGARRWGEIPYDFSRKRLSVGVRCGDESLLVTKGAVSEVLSCCEFVETANGGTAPLAGVLDEVEARFRQLSADGLRVLAVAVRSLEGEPALSADFESRMTLVGFLAFVDPPKADVDEAMKMLATLGVDVCVITGDNRHAAKFVASAVGIDTEGMLLGTDVAPMSDAELTEAVRTVRLFAETDPMQKERIVRACSRAGYTVGYMGDGINDAPSLRVADVGISVDTAVDVAKQTADLVLLDKDLLVLGEGMAEGRRVFANTLKYVHVTTSANFGNMLSLASATLLLPFLPMLPTQVLILNFLSDVPGMTIATDRVDAEQLASPVAWDIRRVRNFMIVFGIASTAFDLLTFLVLRRGLGADAELTRTGWFVESTLTELMAMLMLRTHRFFVRSWPSAPLFVSSVVVGAVTIVLPWMPWAKRIGLEPLHGEVMAAILALVAGYVTVTELLKSRARSLLGSFD